MKTMKIDAILLAVIGLGVVCLAPACPPQPVSPPQPEVADAGADDAEPVPACTTPCCTTCTILAAHSCPEGRPTARGASCEVVCHNAESAPAPMHWPRLTGAPSLVEIQRSFACRGGQ